LAAKERMIMEKEWKKGDKCYAFYHQCVLRDCVIKNNAGVFGWTIYPIDSFIINSELVCVDEVFETKEAAYEWALQKLQTEFNEIKNG
jgi:hypothetical protein